MREVFAGHKMSMAIELVNLWRSRVVNKSMRTADPAD